MHCFFGFHYTRVGSREMQKPETERKVKGQAPVCIITLLRTRGELASHKSINDKIRRREKGSEEDLEADLVNLRPQLGLVEPQPRLDPVSVHCSPSSSSPTSAAAESIDAVEVERYLTKQRELNTERCLISFVFGRLVSRLSVAVDYSSGR
uniref:Uncharacterized protein n=1 Tax=Kalanchoe fedtschenkoi TaxID=63787 RepID=A0A7N0TCY3_KALFE